MNFKLFHLRSIKTRVALFTLAIFLINISALAIYGSGILHSAIPSLIGEQQLSTASIVASGINQGLEDRLSALEAVAETITPAILDNVATSQALLEQRMNLKGFFNAGAFITRLDGQTTASVPRSLEQTGVNLMDRDFITTALKQGKATIGQPAIGKIGSAPMFGMAAPIRDELGNVIGVLVGVIDLSKSNFLDKYAGSSYGKTGGYQIISGQYRHVLASSSKSGIIETLPSVGTDPFMDRLFQGFEGSGVVINSRGVEELVSVKGIPLTDWHLIVTLPTQEAFARFHAARKHMLLATIILTLLASGAIWFIVRRQLTPILETVTTLAALTETNLPPQPLAITSQDEIAELIGSFNRLLATVAQRERALMAVDAELRIAATTFESQEGMIVTDAKSVILRVNKAFTTITGYTAEEAVGQTPNLFKSGRHNSDFYREMWETIKTNGGWQGEIWDRRKNGEIYPKWLTITAVKDKNGLATHYVGAQFDITERKQKEDQVIQFAFYDALTRLPNRRLFYDRLSQSVITYKRNRQNGALMFIDLDNFKTLNDTHGHIAGDTLLMDVANRLKSCVREMDTVARFGGDEFVVLLGELNDNKTESTSFTEIIAEKIRAFLSEPYLLKIKRDGNPELTVEHHCTASIGVAVFGVDAATPEDILKSADAAMYQAKKAGRNSIRFYDSELGAK